MAALRTRGIGGGMRTTAMLVWGTGGLRSAAGHFRVVASWKA